MVRKIVTVPDVSLRQKSRPVKKINAKIRAVAQDLIDTIKTVKEVKGVGLSAVQIGYPLRLFVWDNEGQIAVVINPKIVKHSKAMFSQKIPAKKRFLEGCLSVPEYYGSVDRHYQIQGSWQDLEGKDQQAKIIGKKAAYWQHEYDHLEGILFTDRVLAQKGKLYHIEKDIQGQEELVEVTIT